MSTAAVAITMAVASAATATMEAYGRKKEADYQAEVMEANSKIAHENAYRKRLEASINEDTLRRENREKIARNTAAAIEQGMGGSATTIGALGQQATTLEQNAFNVRYEGLAAAENMDIEADYLRPQAKGTKRMGNNGFRLALLGAPFAAAKSYYSSGGTGGLNNNTKNTKFEPETYQFNNKRYVAWSK